MKLDRLLGILTILLKNDRVTAPQLAEKFETYNQREIPSKAGFYAHLPDDKKLVALFEPSVKYQLIETYGFNCFTETEGGRLRLEIGYTDREYTISWLLGFGNKAKVIEPIDMADEIKSIAEILIKTTNEQDRLLSCSG
jgi:predicted DNA-binding transcriptional regulator YafY